MVLTCEARHAFAYTGHLTRGRTLRRRRIAPNLSNGRAWGAAVAAWHAYPRDSSLLAASRDVAARFDAFEALFASYRADAAEQWAAGVYTEPEEILARYETTGAALDHHMSTTERFGDLTRLEGEFAVPIPSRGGKRASTRYHFHGRIDGFREIGGTHTIVEYKFRDTLTPLPILLNDRQTRDYAWSHQQLTGVPVMAAIVEERLARAPNPAKIVQGKKKGTRVPSHDKDQMTTPEAYIALCEDFDVDPKPDVVEALGRRKWSQRVEIVFRPSELKQAGRDLVSAAQLIRDLDNGRRSPIRNTSTQICRGCRFADACADPENEHYLRSEFVFGVPKRLKGLVAEPSPESEQAGPRNPFDAVPSDPELYLVSAR